VRIRLSATSTFIARSIAITIALLLNVAASIILARKLSPSDYALYQTITKRLTRYSDIPFYLTEFWIYRYLVQKRKGSWEASLIVLSSSIVIGLIVGSLFPLKLGFPFRVAVLGGLALLSFETLREINLVIDALRPLRFGILQIVYRSLYSVLVFVLVYILFRNVVGALTSMIISSLISASLGILWIKNRLPERGKVLEVLKEWLKGISIPALNTASAFLLSLDVFLAYKFIGDKGVAAFFAAFAAFSILREPISRAVRYLQGYLLSGGELEGVLRSLSASIALISPMLSYLIFNPDHVISLFNPKYVFAKKAVVIFSFDSIIAVYVGITSNIYFGLVKGSAEKASKKLIKIYTVMVILSLVYLLMLGILFLSLKNFSGPSLWAFSLMVYNSLLLTAYVSTFPERRSRALLLQEMSKGVIYFLISLPIAFIFRVSRPPYPKFFDELDLLLPSFIITLALYYAIILAISKEIRRGLMRVIRQII
jgi:hypothetical protein